MVGRRGLEPSFLMLNSVIFQTSHPKDPDNLLPGSTHPTNSVALINKVAESYLKGHGGDTF